MVSELTPELSGPDETVFSHDPLFRDEILALDRLAVAAWPAPEHKNLDGWLLRYAEGISRRANSVAPFPPGGEQALNAMIADSESFYRARDLPPRFQISPAAEPHDLDATLAARNYEIETPVSIMIAPATEITAGTSDGVHLHPNPPDGWWDAYIEGYGRDSRAIVAAARDQPMFASITDGAGRTEAIGLGVIGGNWLAVFGMWTRPDARRRGCGERIIHALAAFAVDQGAIGVYLQVEEDNPAACSLYAKLGFQTVYGYHYRTLWTAP